MGYPAAEENEVGIKMDVYYKRCTTGQRSVYYLKTFKIKEIKENIN